MNLPFPLPESLQAPAGFETLASARTVSLDGQSVWHLRHQRSDGANTELGGEHYSLVLDQQGGLLGMSCFSQTLCSGELPSPVQAQRRAYDWLEQHAPDLLSGHAVLWIEPHEEVLQADGRQHTLRGMKVKCRNENDGRYFWVIVGHGGVVQTFERNIIWNDARSRRQSEKWLHDSWLSGQSPAQG
ncbi:hypothetical protein [Massilia sp. BJB1822]|uniref:hypothetical protein n=1 Tax=Massilia sp. BJB1822 TaxID=2744470 RepID=UPI0015944A72|nr:hypothetical protein [Massilia sp. BJB1822]NVD99199.1 hypothetical protein [Massilia sp. BJB1822]